MYQKECICTVAISGHMVSCFFSVKLFLLGWSRYNIFPVSYPHHSLTPTSTLSWRPLLSLPCSLLLPSQLMHGELLVINPWGMLLIPKWIMNIKLTSSQLHSTGGQSSEIQSDPTFHPGIYPYPAVFSTKGFGFRTKDSWFYIQFLTWTCSHRKR